MMLNPYQLLLEHFPVDAPFTLEPKAYPGYAHMGYAKSALLSRPSCLQ